MKVNIFFRKLRSAIYLLKLKFYDLKNDDVGYLKCMFYHRLGYKLDLENPRSFNEKLQWMKLYDRNPKYTEYADKYLVREHIKDEIGEVYLIPLIGVYEKPEDINFAELPERFVLKCNHGASFNIICKDKSKLNIPKTIEQLKRWQNTDFYKFKKEYNYKNIKRRIICEEYMVDNSSSDLFDYKLFCINGKVEMIQVDFDRFGNHKRNIYDRCWNLLDVEISFPRDTKRMREKPDQLNEMIEIAEKLSHEFDEVRVDLYVINNKIYFGEMTFFSGAGFSNYKPREFEYELGKKLSIGGRFSRKE